MVNSIEHYDYEYDKENPHKFSEDVQMKDLDQILNSRNAFILSLVILYVRSGLKILRISWYSSMTPFITNLELIKRYTCVSGIYHSLGLTILLMQ